MALLLSSCRHSTSYHQTEDERRAKLDSVMRNIGDTDSLAALALQSHEQNDAVGEILALKYQGKRLREQSRFAEAIEVFNHGLETAQSHRDTIEMAAAINNLGETYRRYGDFNIANGLYFKALKLCDKYTGQDDPRLLKAVAIALNGIGNIELELKNYALADSVLREALWREQRSENIIGMAVNYAALGRVKHGLGDLDSSWYYHRKSLEYNQMAGNDKGVALCHLHSGELHEASHRFNHAIEEYTLAYNSLKEMGETWHWLNACLSLARAHILLGEADSARVYLAEAEAESERIGSKELQADAHLVHYELSLLQGDSEEALRHYVQGTELMDSVYGSKKSEEMHAQRNDYQNGRINGELDVLNRDLSQMKRSRNIQLALGLLLLLMAVAIIAVLAYAMRVRSRTQRLMSQVEETRSLFFTNVVHQIRTPLSAIMGAIDGIVAGKGNSHDDAQQENYELIERQGNNLLDLVDRILEVGSVRSAITELEWRTCDAVTFIHMVLESYRDRCMERHIELTYAPSESNVDIDTVPRYLSTIVNSLVENAINYGNEFGKITVTTQVDGGMFVIRVADDGLGISKTDLPHVFEPFYRSAAAEPLIEGVGIGLTVVRDMTMALGGIVAADSKEGQGSVFTVKLPCRHTQGVKQRFDQAVEPLVGKLRHQLRSHRDADVSHERMADDLPVALVVEDHADVARLVGMVLGECYNVYYAMDGEQGLAMAGELMPDIVITDVKMPLMDGLELCRQLRQNRQLCHIPVIMLSARNSDSDRVRGIEAGADAYMVKPFVSEELRAWVNRLLENRKMLRDVFAASSLAARPSTVQAATHPSTDAEADAKFLDDFAREVEKYFEAGGKIDLDKVARTFKMGESQMRHKVQVLTGKNAVAYISQLRMEKAMRLLRSSSPDTLISTISEQCGFQDVAYFSRVFRRQYGMTPTQARNGGGGAG